MTWCFGRPSDSRSLRDVVLSLATCSQAIHKSEELIDEWMSNNLSAGSDN